MNINIGDTVVIRGTVVGIYVSENQATVKVPGMSKYIVAPISVFSEVIPKPRLPKVGEIWEVKKDRSSKRKVYYVDDTHVVYEVISKDECFYKRTINYFLDQFQPNGN